ncbi:MAG: prolipoprotein diacylglyceryl transferase [Rickettsiales bacterium]|jgi:phosphatidylglycerol:prolipoprotein diacylglycerol transferase|nr:prolipoprotein diacylglyceryl transferase [Rickettsiales bacterium]
MIFTHYPHPVALQIFGLEIRWYSLAYIVAFLISLYYSPYIAKKIPNAKLSKSTVDDFFMWGVLGVILGGRLGYVLFYNFSYYVQNPVNILALWQGGMSFHGGAIGFISAIFLFAYKRKINPLMLSDIMMLSIPCGLMLGRIANFLNSELFGRPTGMQNYGVIFANADEQLRHPSQLYEAFAEGFIILIIMQVALYFFISHNKKAAQKKSSIKPLGWGFLTSVFLFSYAIARTICETFRMPDEQIGFLTNSGLTMGQLLNVPVIIFSILFFIISLKKWEFFKKD